ncbi:MAG: response regulator [Endomicrobiales bacterium]
MTSILIIDDEIYARDQLARIIERRGFSALVASTGEEGIRMFREKKPDHVFLDILLPGIDGEDVFGYLKDIDARVSVYFMTGCEDIISQEQAMAMGARGFIAKPMYLEDVMRLLDTLRDNPPGSREP